MKQIECFEVDDEGFSKEICLVLSILLEWSQNLKQICIVGDEKLGFVQLYQKNESLTLGNDCQLSCCGTQDPLGHAPASLHFQ